MHAVIRSDATAVLVEQRRALARRPEAIRRVMARAGRGFERDVVRNYMSGRPGLNRISKQAAAGWKVQATVRGDTVTLVVYTTVPYVRFHTDTYRPKGSPRRNPIRIWSGALWDQAMASPLLAAEIARAGFGA